MSSKPTQPGAVHDERVIFEENNNPGIPSSVSVSNRRIVFDRNTYSLEGVTDVKIRYFSKWNHWYYVPKISWWILMASPIAWALAVVGLPIFLPIVLLGIPFVCLQVISYWWRCFYWQEKGKTEWAEISVTRATGSPIVLKFLVEFEKARPRNEREEKEMTQRRQCISRVRDAISSVIGGIAS